MIVSAHSNGWRIIAGSVQGASHKRVNKPNQDFINFYLDNNNIFPIIIAIADGHGGSQYNKSDIGARFAVNSSIEICKEFLENNSNEKILENFNQKRIKETLCKSIVNEWNRNVIEDIKKNELINSEYNVDENEKPIQKVKRPLDINEKLPYGSTILTIIITNLFLLFLQLGDGDILVADKSGEITRPIPKDERLIGNETTSLCLPEAWNDFSTGILEVNDTFPGIMLISTDGYANSYSDESSFQQVLKDILDMVRLHDQGIEEGLNDIEKNLENWLEITSDKGSGDDITVGIVCNIQSIHDYESVSDKAPNSKAELNSD